LVVTALLLITLGTSLFVFVPSASAHTGAASEWFQTFGTLPGGSVLHDVKASWDTTWNRWSYDLRRTGDGSQACGTDPNHDLIRGFYRQLSASGEVLSAWAAGTQSNSWSSGAFGFCQVYYGTTPLHVIGPSEGAGWAAIEFMFRMGPNNMTATQGTLIARASAGAAPDLTVSPPQNLRIASNNAGPSVVLEWDAPATGTPEDGYRVFKSPPEWGVLGNTASGVRDWTDTAGSEAEARCWAVRAKANNRLSGLSNVVCAEMGVPGSEGVPDGGGGISGGDSSDPDSSESCGLNVFCWLKAALKWAFWPSDGFFDTWDGFYQTIRTRPPFSVVIGGFQGVVLFFDNFLWRTGHEFPCITVPGPADALDGGGGTTPVCMADSFSQLANPSAPHNWIIDTTRWFMAVLIIGGTIFACWRILQSAFGRSSGDDGEHMTEAATS
jgi:hypothetical protein